MLCDGGMYDGTTASSRITHRETREELLFLGDGCANHAPSFAHDLPKGPKEQMKGGPLLRIEYLDASLSYWMLVGSTYTKHAAMLKYLRKCGCTVSSHTSDTSGRRRMQIVIRSNRRRKVYSAI